MKRERDGDSGEDEYEFDVGYPHYSNEFDVNSLFSNMMCGMWGFTDPFQDFFNFMPSDFQKHGKRPKQKKRVVYINQIYSPEQIYCGVDDEFVSKGYTICPECNGKRFTGDKRYYCRACSVMDKKRGVVVKKRKGCRVCGGIGYEKQGIKWCKRCNRSGKISQTIKTLFHIPAGWPSNKPIIIKNAYYHKQGYKCDVGLYVLWDDSNTKFKRLDQHLEYNLHISLKESLCGVCATITTLDKREIIVKSTPGEVIKTGDKRVVVGEGMPIDATHKGDLIVTFIVDYPERISIEQARAIAGILNPGLANSDSQSKSSSSSKEYLFTKYNPRHYPKKREEYYMHVGFVSTS